MTTTPRISSLEALGALLSKCQSLEAAARAARDSATASASAADQQVQIATVRQTSLGVLIGDDDLADQRVQLNAALSEVQRQLLKVEPPGPGERKTA